MHLEVKIPQSRYNKVFKDKQPTKKVTLLFLELVMHKLRKNWQV